MKVRYGFSNAVSSNKHQPLYPYKDDYLDELLFEVDEPSLELCDKVALEKIEDLQIAHNDLYKKTHKNVPLDDLETAPVYLNHLYRLSENGEKEMYSNWDHPEDISSKVLKGVKVIRKEKITPKKMDWRQRGLIYVIFLGTVFGICGIFYLINMFFPWYTGP
ncbi:MAG: hypothetical protein LUC43_02285 [Burkholderiales bacterium]|nr:hypothetical protein [Burkholderiales bacterium]